MKNLKVIVGSIAVSAIVLLNLSYAYRGYGFSNDELLKGILAEAESSSECGTDIEGKPLWCKKKKEISINVNCPIITTFYFKGEIRMGEKTVHSDKSITINYAYPYNSFAGYTRTEIDVEDCPITSYGVDCSDSGGDSCTPKKPSKDCSALFNGTT